MAYEVECPVDIQHHLNPTRDPIRLTADSISERISHQLPIEWYAHHHIIIRKDTWGVVGSDKAHLNPQCNRDCGEVSVSDDGYLFVEYFNGASSTVLRASSILRFSRAVGNQKWLIWSYYASCAGPRIYAVGELKLSCISSSLQPASWFIIQRASYQQVREQTSCSLPLVHGLYQLCRVSIISVHKVCCHHCRYTLDVLASFPWFWAAISHFTGLLPYAAHLERVAKSKTRVILLNLSLNSEPLLSYPF